MRGDPALASLGETAPPQAIANLREKWGLNEPIGKQYIDFLGRLMRLNLGTAYSNGQDIATWVWRVLPYTVELALAFVVGALVIGIPFGFLTSLFQNSAVDYVVRIASLAGMSLPTFYIGVLFLLAFSVKLDWFPIMGGGERGNPGNLMYHLFLPGLSGALYLAAYVTRFVRTAMLEVLRQDYMTTARAKGLTERIVIFKHGFRNGLIPLVTVIGLYFAMLLGGSILIEIVFSRPGLGRIVVGAIETRDYILLQSVMIIFVLMVGVVNLLVDLSYGVIDPRIRYS